MPDRPKYSNRKNVPYVLGESEPYIIGHRGGSLEAPENTMQSFLHCVNAGIDVIECDVKITKDGEIIVCHDDNFKRICNTDSLPKDNQSVLETNFADLPVFKQEMPITFTYDGTLNYRCKPGDQNSFSKLDDVFKAISKDQVVHIEIKDQHSEEALRKTI